MSDKKYWQSFAELKDTEGLLRKRDADEFGEELPFEDLDGKGLMDAKTPRRDFLKYLGFSTAAATIAASCKQPVRKAIPYVNRPENLTPGVAKYYASTYVQDGDAVPVLVKVRDGRPIKIEGNNLAFTGGGTSASVQASVLDLYDMYRLPHPKRKVNGAFQEIPSFEQLDTQMASALAGAGGPVVLLTSTIVSPSSKQIITEFLAKYPGSRHVQYDAMSYSGMLLANEATHGKRAIPAYQFDRAKVIVGLGADFLGSWLSSTEYSQQYAKGRRVADKDSEEGKVPTMNKHYQFESYLSLTGSNADERFTHRPSETGAVALALLAGVGGGGTAPQAADPKLAAGINTVVKDLLDNKGAALVVSDSNDVNIQIVVNAINNAIGAYGTTINPGVSLNCRQGIDRDFVQLVDQMNTGGVGALLICGANPAYDYFDAAKFKAGLQKVRLTVSFNEKMDETTELCQYSVPTHHYLESWGDAEPVTGFVSFLQPTIFPLFKTRPFQTSLLKWSGNNTDYETYFRSYWTGKLGSQEKLDQVLQDGFINTKGGVFSSAPQQGATADTTATQAPVVSVTATAAGPFNGGGVGAAIAALSGARKITGPEVVLYQQISVGTGKQAGNPWLLELPDPVTRATWDNVALISTVKAKELGIDYESNEYEYYTQKPLIEITANGVKKTLPILVLPGMNKDTIAIAVGYGRSENFAKATQGTGQNVYGFAKFNGTTIDFYNSAATSEKAVGDYEIAQIQKHNSYEGRVEVLKETTLATYQQNPEVFKEWREELHKDFSSGTDDASFRKEATIYPDHVKPGLKWGMSIDLNACYGCGACVVACHAENNVPVVGKNEVLRAHEMHWLRIDRYFVTEGENADDLKTVVFQPMLCQHCDNAPCENVCPVAATMHSSEGINQMAYNRCIGTRYCANNCPYKVRRFNWEDYTGASTHGVGGPSSGVGKLNDAVHQMNDELTRMVINPDVVTRSRGVMEKCSFCVQRTQEAKLRVKLENREWKDGDVTTACAQACSTNAIIFGNANDPKSAVSLARTENSNRLFYVLEQLHTLPNVSYLAKIRNTKEIIAGKPHKGEEGEEHGPGTGIPAQHEPAEH